MSVTLTPSAYAHGLALAAYPHGWARPTGGGRAIAVAVTVLAVGSEKGAVHRLGLSHSTAKHHLANARSRVGASTTAQLVWILAPRLPEPQGGAGTDE